MSTSGIHPVVHHLPVRDRWEGARSPASSDLGLVGISTEVAKLRDLIRRVAPTSESVVVLGETGTGKELVARALHARSKRATAPFVVTNAAALPETLLDTELFGHERGAFTGAVARHRGLLEQADGGTLFFDELGELNLGAQARLLRVLETGEVRPVGTERARTVSVRVIAATNRDLRAMVAAGTFRSDLYYRLSVLTIEVPPLRERIEDIPVLAETFLAELAAGVGLHRLSDEALGVLARHPWPGNVRELRNVIRRAMILSDRVVIDAASMERAVGQTTQVVARPTSRETFDADTLRAALSACGSLSATARRLGIPRSTLRYQLRLHGLLTPAST